jgi:uncharacterized protein YndB with AHSA1/START domain
MTTHRHGSGVVSFPSDLEIVISRDFDAPIRLVFDVFTREEHVRKTIAPFDEEVTECAYDLRAGGEYRYAFVTSDGTECRFHGTFLEVDEPRRTVETWFFDGWPGAEAVETIELAETDSVTTVTWSLAFTDAAGRARMTKFDGIQANFDNVEDYLRTTRG